MVTYGIIHIGTTMQTLPIVKKDYQPIVELLAQDFLSNEYYDNQALTRLSGEVSQKRGYIPFIDESIAA